MDRCLFAKARFYDPEVGRFISQDSYLGQVDDPPSLHRYFYANDNPTRYVDPTGHEAGDWWDPRTYLSENARAGAWQGFKEGYFENAADIGDSVGALGKGAYKAAEGLVTGTAALAVKGAELDYKLKMGSLQEKQEALQEMYSMGKGTATHLVESGKLLGHGVANPGDVLDAMTELGVEGSSEVVGGATFETGLLLAPFAKGAPAAVVKEGRHGVNLLAPKAVATTETAAGKAAAMRAAERAAARTAAAVEAPSSAARTRPAWLDEAERGSAFNKARQFDYPTRELYLDKPGGGYVRLDAYDPVAGEIVSRKLTQLGKVQESTGIGYLSELATKYPPGARIANVPSSGPLAGRALSGQQILEVPIQTRPIPAAVLSEARRLNIVIRDVAGNVYR